MGAYAVPSNGPFKSSSPLKRKRKITEEQREFMEFVATHNIEPYIDEKTGLGAVKITEKNKDKPIEDEK